MTWADCTKTVGDAKDVATLQCIPVVFSYIVQAAVVFSGLVAVFFIVYAGIQFILSTGEAKQVEGAKKTMTYAILGLIVVLLSFLVVNFIAKVTGVNCITWFGLNFTCQ